MGRRVRKEVWTYNGTSWSQDTDKTQKFVYDGWNIVLVLNHDNETLCKYTWGLDLSGTIHGAGGIGGLLACLETQGTSTTTDDKKYWFCYDANGNVGQVLEYDDKDFVTVAARYEYDPYGNEIVATGDYADDNPFRFSTKWLDAEPAGASINGAVGSTGLYYFGYRYYSSTLGRWINRDPIGELGDLNLMAYVGFSPVNRVDPLGLCTVGERRCKVDVKLAPGTNLSPDDAPWAIGIIAVTEVYCSLPGVITPGILGPGQITTACARFLEALRRGNRMSVWTKTTCKTCVSYRKWWCLWLRKGTKWKTSKGKWKKCGVTLEAAGSQQPYPGETYGLDQELIVELMEECQEKAEEAAGAGS